MHSTKTIFILSVLIGVIATSPIPAEERLDLEATIIIGNQELPKVLYVVPWKLPDSSKLISRPLESEISADLTPLNREHVHSQIQSKITK